MGSRRRIDLQLSATPRTPWMCSNHMTLLFLPFACQFHYGPPPFFLASQFIFHKLFRTFRDEELCNFLTSQMLPLVFTTFSSLNCKSFSIIVHTNVASTHVISKTGSGYNNGISASFLGWLKTQKILRR